MSAPLILLHALDMAPGGENLERLLARWPDYNERIARFIMADPLAPLRLRLIDLQAQRDGVTARLNSLIAD